MWNPTFILFFLLILVQPGNPAAAEVPLFEGGVRLELPVPPPRAAEAGLGELPVPTARGAFLRWVERHPPEGTSPDPGYRFLSQILADLAVLVRADARGIGPVGIRPVRVGRTVRGRPIWGFVVRNPAVPVRRRMLVFGGIHALEWVGAEVASRFLEEAARYTGDGLEITVVPVLNVDGRLLAEGDRRRGVDVFRRGNANHVDLNRDFAVHHEATSFWRHLFPGFHASSPAPLSQPETRALDELAEAGRFHVAFSLHAFGGFVYLPWSGRWERPPQWRELAARAREMTAAQGAHAYRVRQLSRWGFFFRAQGSEIDHLYGRYGTAAYLVEFTRSGLSPFRPWEWKSHFRRYNPRDPDRHVREGVRLLRAAAVQLQWEVRSGAEPRFGSAPP